MISITAQQATKIEILALLVPLAFGCTNETSEREKLALENANCVAFYADLLAYAKNSQAKQEYELQMRGHWTYGLIFTRDRFPPQAQAAVQALGAKIKELPSEEAKLSFARSLIDGCGSVADRSARLSHEMILKAKGNSGP